MTCKARTSFWRAAGLALACLAAVRPAGGFEKYSATAGKLSNSPQPLNYPHLLSHTLSTHSPSPPPLLLRTAQQTTAYSPPPLLYAPSLRAKHNKHNRSPSFGRCLSLMTLPPIVHFWTPPPVMPAEELAQGLVISFPSDKSHRAAIFRGFLYAFIAVVCYGSSSTRARAGDDHAAGPLASAMQPTGVVAGRPHYRYKSSLRTGVPDKWKPISRMQQAGRPSQQVQHDAAARNTIYLDDGLP